MNYSRISAEAKKAWAQAREKTFSTLRKIDFATLLAGLKKFPAAAWRKISTELGKIKFKQILPRLKKEALLMWERILSLRTMRFSPDDPKLFWVSGLLFLIFQGAISALLWRVDSPWVIFTHQVSLSADDFLVQRDNWGPEKIHQYLQHYWLDFFHPAVYALFFRCLLTQIQLSFPTQYVYHSLAFPIAAAIYDEIENVCQLALMAGWTESSLVFYAGAFSALAKWLLLTATFAAAAHAVGSHYWNQQLEGKK
jgi:hypothetical protein